MATVLQKQLAVIAANSTHQLDLKAQKQRHSKSLLFEPRDAASQSFDTIFQVCYEGFEELCMLDLRFTPFAQNLFSEQSKHEDRTQMTAEANEELDRILHSFLGLVCGRLLLKPAIKAVEWLVRRFRVQEYNTEWTLLTFLPYHSSHIFPTLMSILPEQLPATFRFLHPYVASLQSPPRHAILSAAISNQAFFSCFSQYVLKIARAKHHSAVLLGFWASITAQAVNGMIDSTRSGRDSIRKQREEDLLLRVLPVLQSAISIKGVQELYVGSCLIITILATKASLADNALDAMMEAVAGAWTEETETEGLTCLALLAEEKQHISQPPKVTKALIKSPKTLSRLSELSTHLRVSRLVLLATVGIVERLSRLPDLDDVAALRSVVELDLLTDQHCVSMLQHLLPVALSMQNANRTESWTKISRLLNDVADAQGKQALLVEAANGANVSLASLGLEDSNSAAHELDNGTLETMEIDTAKDVDPSDEFKAILKMLPQVESKSFWTPEADGTFAQYLRAFEEAIPSSESLDRLLCQNYLCKPRATDRPTFLTFAARAWSSGTTQAVKVKAINLATEVIQDQQDIDLQALLPYALTALASPSQRIRKTAAKLCIALSKAYGQQPKDARLWAKESAYGPSASTLQWQTSEDAYKLLKFGVLPVLEGCILDTEHITRSLANTLNTDNVKQLKKSSRQAACSSLASQAVATPILQVRLITLRILGGIGKIANEARAKHLIALIRDWARLDDTEAKASCAREDVDLAELDRAVINAISHRTQDDLRTLQEVASGRLSGRASLSDQAFTRLKRVWVSLNDDSRIRVADVLLEHALTSGESELLSHVQTSALETLRNVALPSSVMVHLIETLPNASDLQDQAPATKKRRTSGSQNTVISRPVDQVKLQAAIRRITLVLELVEDSKPEHHPQLLKPLFHLLSELHHYRTLTGSELVYLQGIILGCLNSVVSGVQQAGTTDADRSVIRADLIVDCVRTTSSTQTHNAALLLMSSLASWAPELVLHSVMPLFTFMSSTLLRQHDDFSAHVTDQTVARIVPALATSLKKKGKDLVTGAAELLLSFTAAFEHIPLHRRLGLFRHLVDTLGADETLFAVIAMLVERYSYDGPIPAFVGELVNYFPTTTALQTGTQYLDLIFDALKPKSKLADVLLGFGDKDEDAREDSVEDLLEGLAVLLENAALRERLALKATDEQLLEIIRSKYSVLLEKTMQLTRDLAQNEALAESANNVLASVLGLMPTSDFIDSSAQLMQTGSHETRQQVFRSLEARVVQARRGDKEAQNVFVEVLPNCGVFIDKSQPIATRSAAVSCVDQICEKFGKTDTDAVISVAEIVAGEAALGSEDPSLRIISILCLASMVEVLSDGAVAILPTVLTQTLEYMHQTLEAEESNEQLLAAGFSLLGSVMDHLPWMLSATYLDDALKLTAKTTAPDDAHLSQVFVKLVATKVGPQELFAAVERTWDIVLKEKASATQSLLEVMSGAIEHHRKASVTKNASTIFPILLKAFDLRRNIALADDDDDKDKDEEFLCMVDQLALDTTLKLNDATFRPFFIRLVEWSGSLPKRDTRGRELRATSLFSFTLMLFEQLKSIVTSYASFILDNVVAVLQQDVTRDATSQALLDLCLRTLSTSFSNDQDDFWQSPAHFDTIAEPVVSQLLNYSTLPASTHIIPTITALAATASSFPDHLKTINTRLMQLMKHPDAAVRLAAVQCQRSVTERLTFDWLALLPEMLPAISEAQEDDSEAVEGEVLRWVREIEGVTGESLEGMLA